MIYGTDLASATLCVEIAFRRVGLLVGFSKNGQPGEVKCGLGLLLVFPYFGLLGASSGPFSHYLGVPPLGHAYCPFKGPCLLPL